MSMQRDIINTLFEKNAQLEKRAFITHLLKPIDKTLKGKDLVSRIAPLGMRRIMADTGHALGNVGLGSLAGAGVAGAMNPAELLTALKGGGISDALSYGGAIGGAGTVSIGHLLDQSRANKYLDMALKKGPNRLSKSDLKGLLGEMSNTKNFIGSDNLVEFLQGRDARKRVQDAINKRIL